MSDLQNFDISAFIEGEYNYSSMSHRLPKMVAESDKIIGLRDADSSLFYTCSAKALQSLIENILQAKEGVASFFDGMDSFHSGGKINMNILDSIDSLAPEYDEKAAKSLFDK